LANFANFASLASLASLVQIWQILQILQVWQVWQVFKFGKYCVSSHCLNKIEIQNSFFFKVEIEENELNLRRNIILGGVYYFDMLQIPPQPKRVGNWVICQLETPQVYKQDTRIVFLFFYVNYVSLK